MAALRTLVVDDSVTARRALTDAIESDPGFTVSGAAPNGLLALEMVGRSRPDLIVLDLDMPVMDGLEFLSRLRPLHPRLPVLVFSGTLGLANESTLEAMWRGASDYLLKPRGMTPDAMGPFLRAELLPRLRALGRLPAAAAPFAVTGVPAAADAAPVPPLEPGAAREPVARIVLVGASTGGPRALAAMLGALPDDFRLPIVVVQHMPAEMTEFFAAGLAFNCRLPVRLAGGGMDVSPGTVWVAAGGAHLVVLGDGARSRFLVEPGPEIHGCRPALDPLLASAARVYGSGVLAVVLTGMGRDGLEGARAVHAAHGRVLVQDEPTSVVWGMPGTIARAGLAHAVLPLAEMTAAIVARAQRVARGGGPGRTQPAPPRSEAA